MNLQQLEYILAVDTHRHFAKAADASFVTQPTLSAMIQKLEDELEIKIFDRSKQPVVPTRAGVIIIDQARVILQETLRMKEIIREMEEVVTGEFRLGIIPTVAPYLLPLFLHNFLKKYDQVKLKVIELTTEEILDKLQDHELDGAILATPVNFPNIIEHPVFYEEFVVYASGNDKLMEKKFVLPGDIDPNKLWLLEEGHCLRSQIVNLCELRQKGLSHGNFEYEAGSIETLKKMVDINNGITVLPELAVKELSVSDNNNIRHFQSPVPVREISLITSKYFVKKRILNALAEEIKNVLPEEMLSADRKMITNL